MLGTHGFGEYAFGELPASGTTPAPIVLVGVAGVVPGAAGALSTVISLAGTCAVQPAASGSFAGSSASLAGTAVVRPVAGATLSNAIRLSGTAMVRPAASGAITILGRAMVDASKVSLSRSVSFGGGSRVVVFDIKILEKESVVANSDKPYFKDGKWWVDKDPDEKSYYVADISKELVDRATTAKSVVVLVGGVTVLEGPEIQGSLVVVKLEGMDVSDGAENFWTARVTCANTERFDRTTWLNRVDN
jgi:hypothetical protein